MCFSGQIKGRRGLIPIRKPDPCNPAKVALIRAKNPQENKHFFPLAYGHLHGLTHSLSRSLTHSLTHSLSRSLSLSLSLSFTRTHTKAMLSTSATPHKGFQNWKFGVPFCGGFPFQREYGFFFFFWGGGGGVYSRYPLKYPNKSKSQTLGMRGSGFRAQGWDVPPGTNSP